MATTCLPLSTVKQLLRKVAKAPIDEQTSMRVDIHEINNLEVEVMLDNLNINHLTKKIDSTPILSKLNSNLKFTKRHEATTREFIQKLRKGGKVRDQAIALDTILESVKGEVDKAYKMGLDVSQVSSDGVTPNLPLHRMAATIGRKILYRQGYRATKKLKGEPAPIEVEVIYHDVGLRAIKELADKEFITMDEGKQTIKDYLEDIDDKRAYREKDIIVTDNPSVSIKLDAFGLEKNPKSQTGKDALRYFTDRATSDISKHELGEYVQVLKAVNLLSVPANVSFPMDTPGKGLHKNDVYTMDKKTAGARKELNEQPLYIDKDLHSMFDLLHKATSKGTDSATTKLRQLVDSSPELMQSLFKVDIDNDAVSEYESVKGRNLSNSIPVDDLVEYWDGFSNADQGMYFDMFAGRNSRLYVDNSVMNFHASKIMRHSLAVAPYTMDTGSEVYRFYVGKVAHVLGVDPADLVGARRNKDLETALRHLDRFSNATTLKGKIDALTFMHEMAPHMDFAELVSTLKAAKGIRESVDTGTLTSTYPVSSDATASGGLLMLLQALGSNPQIEELLTEMGILGDLKGKDRKLPDVYRILQNKLELYFKNEEDPDGSNYKQKKGDPAKTKEVLQLVAEHIYKKDIRDLAKKPTMTFIYGQSKGAAEVTLSQELTDRTLKELNKGSKEAIALINAVLDTDYTVKDVDTLLADPKLKKDLAGAFNASGAPGLLHSMLTGAITNKYLDEHQTRAKRVFQLIERYTGTAKMKVLTASARVEMGDPESKTQLEKYGVPLQKIFEVRHDEYGPPVLTREGKLQSTVMGVSLIHSADTAGLFRSLAGLPTKHNTGVITVHDDMRSSPALIMEGEKNYIAETLKVAQEYDIHEQVLLAAAKYDKDIANDPEFKDLIAEITETKKAKLKALEKFNHETDSIIGDPLPEFDAPVAGYATKKSDTAADTETTAAAVGLESLAGDSEIITEFLASSNQAEVQEGDVAKFDPKKDKIILPKGTSRAEAVTLAEHEIVHSYTSAVIQQYYQNGGIQGIDPFSKQSDIDVAYIEKALNKLKKIPAKRMADLDPEVTYTIGQIASSETPVGVAELVSVLSAEPKAAEAIYGLLNEGPKGKLRMMIDRIVNRIREVLRSVDQADLEAKNVDINLVYSSVNSVLAEGQSMREQKLDTVLELQKGFGDLYSNKAAENKQDDRFAATQYVDAINEAVSRGLNDPALRQSGQLLKKTDLLLQKFPMYKTARDKIGGIYESSGELQKLMHTITNANINKETKNEVLSAFAKVRTAKNEITNVELEKFAKETSKLTDAEKKDFYDFVHRMPLHDFYMLAEEVTDIDLAAELIATEFTDGQLEALDSIVDLRVNEKVTPNSYYTVSSIFDPNGDMGKKARKYIVLKSISEIGVDKWENLQGKTELAELMKDASLSNAMLNQQHGQQKMSDTLVRDFPKDPVMVKAVSKEEMRRYSYEENSGWKVLQSPEAGKPGIVYRRVIDQTYMEGAFTDIKFEATDIEVGEEFRGMKNVVKTPDGYRLLLDSEQKKTVGIMNDAEQGLVRSMTHAMAIQDSQNIRDRLLQNDTYYDLKKNTTDRLETMIKDKDMDHPWFLSGGIEYHKLPKLIQNKYQPVDVKLSNVNGFNDKIEYVRKDISHWLIGRTERSLFNDPKLQWATRITKNLMATTKIGMVILNPMKIVADNMSNVAYLAVRGVDPLYMQKQYRQISKEFHDYQQMKNRLNHMRVKGYAAQDPEATIKKRVAKLEKQLKEHPANGLVERGFINSLGSDLVLRAGDPSAGLKSDMDATLRYLFKSKDGENNHAAKLLMKLANWNVGLDEFLEIFAQIPAATDSTKNFEKEIRTIAKRLKNIKSEDDVISYMHQYLNSPDSEFTKMGTYMTDLTDVLSKETLYRFLVEKGVDPKKAEIDVIDSFPDYKENLPTRVKQLSDVGIIMFPSYWLRIQKAIYRMVKNQPVSFGTEWTAEQMLGIDAPQIWDANIVSKAAGNYGLVHTPWEHMGTNTIFPTNIL